MDWLFVFAFGACIGSFLNVVIYRTPLERSVNRPGSGCTSCGTPLEPWQNVPILAYLKQKGRCHYCASSYSPRYMLIELFMAIAAVALYAHYGALNEAWLSTFVLTALCTSVFFTDLDHWLIPDQITYPGVVLGFVIACATIGPVQSLAGLAVGWAAFYTIQKAGLLFARQDAMGGGDVKFAALIGAFLGLKLGALALGFSFVLGGLYALPMILARRDGKEPVPFGTFMAVAAIAVALGGTPFLKAQGLA